MAFGSSAVHKCFQVIHQGRRPQRPRNHTQHCARITSVFTHETMTEAMEGFLLADWRVLVSLSVVAIVLLYFYLMTFFDHWKKQGIPELSTPPVPIFGHTFKLLVGQRNFTDTFDDLYELAGDRPFVGFYQGTQPALLVRDPDLLKHILIKDFNVWMDRAFEMDEEIDPLNSKGLFNLKGQRWRDMRNRLSPTFTSGRMKAMHPLMQVCAEELLQCLKTEVEKNGGLAIVEIKEYLACFTTDVIATCAFGIRCDALQNPETSEFRKMGKLTFKTTWKRSILLALLLISPKLLKFLGLKFTMDESSVFFGNFVKSIVEQREAAIEKGEGAGYGDFMHHLVLLKKRGLQTYELKDDDEEDELSEFLDTHKQKNGEAKVEPSWKNLELDDLTAQVMLFFSAGFETTSSLISFALFELSSSENGREIQRKVREEVDRVMKEDGGKITYDGLKRMRLLDRVLSETLRLYPPAGILSRKSLKPYKIPGTNLTLEKGTQVFIAAQAMQHDEKFFPNPRKFDPDRFLPEQKEQWNQFAYLPFGDGPRLCIGQRFAQMQARLGLAAVLSKFEFELCREKTSVPLKFNKRAFILTAETGIWLKTKLRE